jgi:hypothetical protein
VAAIAVIARILICSFLLQLVPLAIVYEEAPGKVPGVATFACRLRCGEAFAIIHSTIVSGKGYRQPAVFSVFPV